MIYGWTGSHYWIAKPFGSLEMYGVSTLVCEIMDACVKYLLR